MTIAQGLFFTILTGTIELLFLLFHWQKLIAVGLNQTRHTRAYQHSVLQPHARILIIGDSSAVGVGAHQPRDSIAGQLASDYPTADILNVAKNGSRLHGTLRQLRKLPRHAATTYDLMLIQVGANDVVGGTPYPKILRRLHKLLSLAKFHAHDVVHIMSSDVSSAPIIPLTFQWYFSSRYHQVREIFIQAHAQHQTQYIDLYRPWSQDPFAQQPFKYYSADGMHPSSRGYAYIYKLIQQHLPLQLAKTNPK
jgi:lysophospholipase L1-like esterase